MTNEVSTSNRTEPWCTQLSRNKQNNTQHHTRYALTPSAASSREVPSAIGTVLVTPFNVTSTSHTLLVWCVVFVCVCVPVCGSGRAAGAQSSHTWRLFPPIQAQVPPPHTRPPTTPHKSTNALPAGVELAGDVHVRDGAIRVDEPARLGHGARGGAAGHGGQEGGGQGRQGEEHGDGAHGFG